MASEQTLLMAAKRVMAEQLASEGRHFDASRVKIYKFIRKDLDRDGEEEIVFAAGVDEIWGAGTCIVLDRHEQHQIAIPLVPLAEGFRDLAVFDINADGEVEIVSLWQSGSGAFLALSIWRWRGDSFERIFPPGNEAFHQGIMELRDLDGDGVDEILIWESLWRNGVHWGPHYFDIHVFGYDGERYRLQSTCRTKRRYLPADILGKTVGLMGISLEDQERQVSNAKWRHRVETAICQSEVDSDLLDQLVQRWSLLQEGQFYDEAAEMINLAIEAARNLSSSRERAEYMVLLFSNRASTLMLLGDYREALDRYSQSLAMLDGLSSVSVPPLFRGSVQRHMGVAYLYLGAYEHSLEYLDKARRQLEENRESDDAFAKIELSRALSNLGVCYAYMGETERALRYFESAVCLDRELKHRLGLSINLMSIANILRDTEKVEESLHHYDQAIEELGAFGERDRESDIYIEKALALLHCEEFQEALETLRYALLLSSHVNWIMQGGKTYLYLGEAYRRLGDAEQAAIFLGRACAMSEKLGSIEVAWRSRYALGQLNAQLSQYEDAYQHLECALNIIESIRSQELPEMTKIALFENKEIVYEAMVFLLLQLAEQHGHDSSKAASLACTALWWVEKAKCRTLVEELAKFPIRRPANVSNLLLAKEAEHLGQIERLRNMLKEAPEIRRNELLREMEATEDLLEKVREEIRASGREGADYVEIRTGSPADFDSIKHLLETS